MGGIFYHQSDWIPALHHTTRAMVLREQMGYTWGVASTLGNLGILAVSAGQWSKAWSFFERCLALQQEMGNIEGLAIAHNNLGLLSEGPGKTRSCRVPFPRKPESSITIQDDLSHGELREWTGACFTLKRAG